MLGSKNIYFPFPLAETCKGDGNAFLPLWFPCWPFLSWITAEYQRQSEEEEVWGEGTFPSLLTRTAEERGRRWKNRSKICYFYPNLTPVITFKNQIFEHPDVSAILNNLRVSDCFYFLHHRLPFDDSPGLLSAVIPAPFDLQGPIRSELPRKVLLASVPSWPPCCLVSFTTWASNLHDSVLQTCSHGKSTHLCSSMQGVLRAYVQKPNAWLSLIVWKVTCKVLTSSSFCKIQHLVPQSEIYNMIRFLVSTTLQQSI